MKKYNGALEGIRVLTTDMEKRIGFYACRYLGEAGALIDGVGLESSGQLPIGFYSNHIRKKISLSQSNFDSFFYDYIIRNHGEYDYLNPIDVSKMLVVLDSSSKVDINKKYLLPHKENLLIANDKEKIAVHAQDNGFLIPKTYLRVEVEDLYNEKKIPLDFPCIVKFRGDDRMTHWRPQDRYSIATSRNELIEVYKRMHQIEEYPVIQEYIFGVGVGYFALYDRSRNLKAHFCHERIREYPVSGGPSSFCKSFYDKRLINMGSKLLESLNWSGLAMVECKYNPRNNKFYLIEINPRYWGSMPLSIYSGVNFPVLHTLSSLGISYEPVLDYKIGVKMRFIDKDIKSIYSILRTNSGLKLKIDTFSSLLDFRVREGFFIPKEMLIFMKYFFGKLK